MATHGEFSQMVETRTDDEEVTTHTRLNPNQDVVTVIESEQFAVATPSEDGEEDTTLVDIVRPVEQDPVQTRLDHICKLLKTAINVTNFPDMVSKMNAVLVVIGKLVEPNPNALDLVRGMLGVLHLFTGVPILPIFNTIVSIFYSPPPTPNPVSATLDQIKRLLGDVRVDIRNLEDKLRTVIRVELYLQRFQECASAIDDCVKKMNIFLRNAGEPMCEIQFFKSATEAERAFNNLKSMVVTVVGPSIMDAQYEDCRGRPKPVVGLAYVIHTYLLRGMACLQVYTVYRYGEALWEQNLLALSEELEACNKKITDTVQMCKDNVGENLRRDYREGIKIESLETLWRKLLLDYEVIVDMRYLEIYFSHSDNGWDNTKIYCANFVEHFFEKAPGDRPTRGVIVFYWRIEGEMDDEDRRGDRLTLQGLLQEEFSKASKQITTAVHMMSLYSDVVAFQYLAGSTNIPVLETLVCPIIVLDYATGWCYTKRYHSNTVILSRRYHSGKRTLYGKTSSNGSSCIHIQWKGIKSAVHKGVACMARTENLCYVEGYGELVRDKTTGDCRKQHLTVTTLPDEHSLMLPLLRN